MKKILFLTVVLFLFSVFLLEPVFAKSVKIKINYIGYNSNVQHHKLPVLVELRSGDELTTSEIVSQKAGIVNEDGIVELDFSEVEDGDYWILVRAGGFLPVCSSQKQNLSADGIFYNFTSSSDKAILGTNAMREIDGKWQVRPGDLDGGASIGAFDINYLLPNLGKSLSSSYPTNDYIPRTFESVIIGEQEWMSKNLDVAYYRNGDEIPHITDPEEWANLTSGAWCYYDNDPDNGDIYGKLYNWYAVTDPRGLAPEGWHLPSDNEWKILEIELGMSSEDADSWNSRGAPVGSKLAGGYALWQNGNLSGDITFNSSGFMALPAGRCTSTGEFDLINSVTYLWTTSEQYPNFVIYRYLTFSDTGVGRWYETVKKHGFSVRCVKD